MKHTVETMQSKDDLIREQAQSIVQKDKFIAKLQRRIKELEQLLHNELEAQTIQYRKIKPQLERWKQPILELIINLAKQKKRAISYGEIVKAFHAKYPHVDVKPVTIRRRVRLLREDGLLRKQGRDQFYPRLKP